MRLSANTEDPQKHRNQFGQQEPLHLVWPLRPGDAELAVGQSERSGHRNRDSSRLVEESSEPDDIHIPVKEFGEQSGESSEWQHGRSRSRASYPEEKSEQANNRLSNSL
jgi:hypothetical protein